jgi:prevent-host-death family protein
LVPESVSIEEAEADLFGLLAQVENGEEFVITRDGEPVVLFAPAEESANPSPAG